MSRTEFDERVRALTGPVRAFLRRRVTDATTADDLAQETFLRVYRSRAGLRADERLEAWLYRIARRTLADHYRRRRLTEELPAEAPADALDGAETFDAAERARLMKSLTVFLDELPDAYREPVRLAELESLPLEIVARRLGLTLAATKSRVRRGRLLLKAALQRCCRFEFDRYGKVIAATRRTASPQGDPAECACDRSRSR
jgi:RNA polymerase sigma-70 factor (ECF subfamily)